MFEGFADEMVDLGDVRLRVRLGGQGPALLLIHGHPRTSATWHRVAPQLITAGLTVVCPDMRGYGRSDKLAAVVQDLADVLGEPAGENACAVRMAGLGRRS